MVLAQRLEFRQSQSLVMTPQLQQAIKLLQLSNIELAEFVENELEQNPLLERDEGLGPVESSANSDEPPTVESIERMDSHDVAMSGQLSPAGEAPLDTEYDNVWESGSLSDEAGTAAGDGETLGSYGSSSGGDYENYDATERLVGEETLRDHLVAQIGIDLSDPQERLIGLALVDLLDECGYLTGDLASLGEQLGCPLAQVKQVLAKVQRCDPAGVFARSLKECLSLQLAERDRLDPCMQALLDHLDLLAARNLPALLRVCRVDPPDLADMIAEIKALDPKPGLAFSGEPPPAVIPDVLLRRLPAGGHEAAGGNSTQAGDWVVELNPDTLPAVLVNRRYYTAVSKAAREKSEKEYLAEKMQAASWLVRSLHQRATTILRVANEIVLQQDAFFRNGISGLKPLILRDVAAAIGMHESTISRVTNAKFIATPRGVFELKYFFTTSIGGANGQDAHSAEAVRFQIKSLIEAEPRDGTLSDDRLVELLRGGGIEIARRTVAKYREAMRIPTASQRRRDKLMRM